MTPYSNLSGTSNVHAYQLGDDHIIVQFNSGRETYYKYTHLSAGLSAVTAMHQLAQAGRGLNSYISRLNPGYSSKAAFMAAL